MAKQSTVQPNLDKDRPPGNCATSRREFPRWRWGGYLLAILMTGLAVALHAILPSWFGGEPLLILLVLPILISAYVGGLWPGLVSTVIAAIGSNYLILAPRRSFSFGRSEDVLHWLMLVVAGLLSSVLMEALHRARRSTAQGPAVQREFISEKKLTLALAVVLAFLSLIAITAVASFRRMHEDRTALEHSHEVLAALREAGLDMISAQSAQRGFTISGEERFAGYFAVAATNTVTNLRRLHDLVENDPAQRERLSVVVPLLQERMELAGQVIELRRLRGFEAARLSVPAGKGSQLQGRIVGLLEEMKELEQGFLLQHKARADRSSFMMQFVIIAGGAVTFGIVVVLLFLFGQDFAGRRRAQAALREAHDQLELRVRERTAELAGLVDSLRLSEARLDEAQHIAETGSYLWEMNSGKISWSAELYRIQGLDASEPACLDTFLGAVHPDDRERIQRAMSQSRSGQVTGPVEFRLLRRGGDVRHLVVNSTCTRDEHGAILRTIGTVQDITDRKRVEEALRTSEERLRLAVEAAHIGLWDSDLKTGRLYWSPSLERMHGFESGAFPGTRDAFLALVHPEDLPKLIEARERAVHEAGAYNTEFRVRRQDGVERWALVRGQMHFDAQGRPERILGIEVDVTEQKRAELALQASERFALATLDALSAHLCVLDENGVLLAVNRSWKSFACENPPGPVNFGVGENYLEICDRAAAAGLEEARDFADGIRAVLRGEVEEATTEYRCDSSTESRWYAARVRRFADVTPLRLVVSHENNTVRRRAEHNLEANRRFLSDLIEHSGSLIMVKDLEGRYVLVNQKWEEVTRVSRQQALGNTDQEIFQGPDGQAFRDNDLKVLASGQSRTFEESLTDPSGVRHFLSVKFPMRNTAGQLSGTCVMASEITERKHAEGLLRGQKHVLELIARDAPLGETLDTLLRLIESQAEGMVCSVLLLDPDGQHLRHGGAPSLPEEYVKSIDGLPIGPDEGTCGTAAFRRAVVVVEDIATDPLWNKYRDLALAHGWRACWSTPIFDNQCNVLGTFAVYYRVPGPPPEQHRHLIDLATHTASIAIGQHRAVMGLAESENRLRTIVESEPECVLLLGEDGSVVEINPAGLAMIEAESVPEVAGLNFGKFLVADHRQAFLELIRQTFAGNPGMQEFRVVGTKGAHRWLEAHTAPLRDRTGGIISALAVARDVTGRKRAEESLHESEARFHSVWENSVDGMRLLDAEGRIVAVNAAFSQLVGMRGEELEGQIFTVTYGGAQPSADMLLRYRERFVKRSIPQREERLVTFRNGKQAHLEMANSFLNVPGRPTLLLGIFRDITQRKLTEADLSESEARFRLVVENASDLINIINDQGVFIFQSPSGERAFGYPSADLLGHPATEFIHEEDSPRVLEAIGRTLVSPEQPVSIEYRFRHRNGTWKIIESVGKAMPSKTGERWILVNSRDVTESRRLGEQLRQSQKMEAIGQLSGGVAHDFNNLLTVIQGHASILELDQALPAGVQESVHEIQVAAERAANLTQQLLAFGRRQTMLPRDLDLNQVVANTTKMLQRILGEDIRIEYRFGSQPLGLHADAGMLDQVLLNLAVNSRDAMPGGGRLTLETSAVEIDEAACARSPGARAGSFVCLSVTDTGTGIPPEVLPRIFDPFFTTKDVGKGTGLGLATVYGIVQQHQGWVDVESTVGKGTTFRVFLPRSVRRIETAPRPALATMRGGTETILLVEDDPTLRALFRGILSQLGYRIMEASTGPAALELWKEHHQEIQLLLTDMVMPAGLSGLDLAKRLQSEAPGLRVVYISGYSPEFAGLEMRLQEGANFLGKPFTPQKLTQTVREALDRQPLGA